MADQLRLLTVREVSARVGLAVPTLWAMVARGDFPIPIKVTKRSTRWRSEEVEEWIETRPRTKEAA